VTSGGAGTGALQEAPLPAVRTQQVPQPFVSSTAQYVASGREISDYYLRDLSGQVGEARSRENGLWMLFVLLFFLTLAVGGAGVVFIFLGGLKVAVASGAVGLISGSCSAMLKQEHTTQTRNREAVEAKRDEQVKLRQGEAAVDALPAGPDRERLRVEYTRKLLARIPTK
jgi:hypothetical protein